MTNDPDPHQTGGAIPATGGDTDPAEAQAVAADGSDSGVESDTATCPAACHVTVKTRAGDIPIPGCIVECDGRRLGITGADGVVRGNLSACEGTANLKVIYENQGARLKREEFTLEMSDIDLQAGTATGGAARNFISKVQDVFGSGEGGFPGDLDFEDSYDGADLVSVGPPPGGAGSVVLIEAKMATISFVVPYVNQNDANETVSGTAHSGSVLCMPTSGEMLAGYWEIEAVSTAADGTETRRDLTRLDIMNQAYSRNTGLASLSIFPRHWQRWDNYRGAVRELVEASDPGDYTVTDGPTGNARENIPSAYADGLTDLLEDGKPTVTSTYATDGHVMIVIGAVVKSDDETDWLIVNDPNGTLASTDSVYGTMDIDGPVGLRGASTAAVMNAPGDVRAVQEVLTRLGHYNGPLGAPVDETDPADPTVAAIRAFQGARGDGRVDPGGSAERRMNAQVAQGTRSAYSNVENERNRSPAHPTRPNDRGRHVYYSSRTEGAGTRERFQLKGEAWSCVIEPVTPLTTEEISERLVPGTLP